MTKRIDIRTIHYHVTVVKVRQATVPVVGTDPAGIAVVAIGPRAYQVSRAFET